MDPNSTSPTSVSPGSQPVDVGKLASAGEISPTTQPVTDPPASQGTHDAGAVKWPGAPLELPSSATVSLDNIRDARKPSIQIKPHSVMSGEPKKRPSSQRRRLSSPPPPPVFRSRVSFDTFEIPDKKEEPTTEPPSFTLNSKHKDYEYNKRSRTFLCGLDSNDYSEYALEWLIDELVDDGDEVVCLRVLDPEVAKDRLPASRYREEAEMVMRSIEKKNHENKAINLILEFSVGKVERVIKRMIEFYEPAILIVGTRGRSLGGFQGLLPGSISKFCLQNSAVPVIVVRPNMQRSRGKRKRQQDPTRQGYRDLLDRAGFEGHILDEKNRYSVDYLGGKEEERPASTDESAAVAAAIGFRKQERSASKGSPLTKVESATTDVTTTTESEAGSESGNARLMKSPEMIGLESPELSGESAFGDDDTEGEGPSTPSSPETLSRQAPNVIVRRATGELE
ncbi:uncharacterized protein PV09_01155 [Verruconis gallopava]|uniref:UspA domain-containing protein n=1 Tax=Verruconis gallopava TaxID=253628 RepID=A0A0D1Z5G9_9PEZI|nr:uncharacterized protein PV09_01155 [Verruconis gallopava]KIW08227.1 hypothetical protein PV09_01155 [Verruconis gallopava]